MIMVFLRLIDKNYPSFNCAAEQMYLTTVNTDSNLSLVLNRASLDIICAPSVGEEQDAIFESVLTTVRYIYYGSQLKNDSSYLSV